MELLQLRYFCMVAKYQNMTKAAAELMISQPALSKTISALEKEIGTPLFERRSRSIYLNRAGELFYQKVDQSIKELDDTVREIRELSNEPFGHIKLLVLAASTYMPNLYIAIHKKYPNIKLLLSNYIRSEHLFMYDCDFCITAGDSYTPMVGNCLVRLLTERFVLAVHKDHPLAGRSSIHLKETAPYPFIASNRKEDLEYYCLKAGFRPNIIAECDNGTTYETLLRNNMGITVLPEITLGSILPDEIVCIPLTFPILERTVNLAYDSRKKMSQACRLFLEFCTEYFCAHPEGRQEGAPLQSGQRFAQGPAAF